MPQEFIQHALGRIAPEGADSTTVADSIVRTLRSVFVELEPLIGSQAVRALYTRSLHVTRGSATLLSRPGAEPMEELLGQLHRDIAACEPAVAQRLGRALLDTLAALVISLIGGPLTHRLLRSAWGSFASDTPSQESSQ